MEYGRPGINIPACSTTVRYGPDGREKSVIDVNDSGPLELWAIQAVAEAVVERATWTRDAAADRS